MASTEEKASRQQHSSAYTARLTVQNKSFSTHEQINEAEPVSSTQHVPVAYTHTPTSMR
jgi:hypothetical protein